MSLDTQAVYRWNDPRAWGCRKPEPGLEQLLQDPLIRMVMASDGVVEADIRALAGHARLRRGEACA